VFRGGAHEFHASRSDRPLRAHFFAPVPTVLLGSLGTHGPTMSFEGSFGGIDARILADSGADNSFVSRRFALTNRLHVTPFNGHVKLGDNRSAAIVGKCKAKLQVQGHRSMLECLVIELLEDYDVVLGDEWFRRHRVSLNWENQTLTTRSLRRQTVWRGAATASSKWHTDAHDH